MKCRNQCKNGSIRIPFGDGWRICPLCGGKGKQFKNQKPKQKKKK